MKKLIFKVIIFALCIILFFVVLFFHNTHELCSESIVALSKIFIQAVVSGVITYVGLLITILSQEHQNNLKEKYKLCPSFILCASDQVSAIINEFNINDNVIRCDNKENVRIVKCKFVNTKDNYGINVNIRNNDDVNNYIGNVKNEVYEIEIALNANDSGLFYIDFEDVYGEEYRQLVNYKYLVERNEYKFLSSTPERKVRNVKEY